MPKSKPSLSGLLEQVPFGLLVFDAEQRVVYLNRAARNLLSIPGEGLPEVGILDLLEAPDFLPVRRMISRFTKGVTQRWSEELLLGGRTYLCSVSQVEDESLCLIVQDVSDIKEAEAQDLQSSKMSAVGQLAAGVAHEFNNLIAGIYGYAQFMKEHPEPHVVEKGVEIILRSSERARELTGSLLTFSRRRPGRREPVDLNQILTDTLLLSHRQLERSRIQVVRDLGAIPVTVADGGKIQQVCLDLIVNAQQAMGGGGTLTVSTRLAGNMIEIKVTDDGPGIPEEHLDRVFEPFFTTKGALGGARIPGTGLGLSTAYNTVRDHGGVLRVVSKPGNGATFLITLPVRTLHEAPEKSRQPNRPRSLDRSGRVLVVDDDPTLRSLVSEILGDLGHEVREAEGGEYALGILETWSADLIIIDRMVWGMGDMRAYDRLRELHDDLPVIFITSKGSEAELESEGDPWMFRLNKPFRNRDLITLVSRVLSQRLGRAS
jgi:signal transduction histidine kinase